LGGIRGSGKPWGEFMKEKNKQKALIAVNDLAASIANRPFLISLVLVSARNARDND